MSYPLVQLTDAPSVSATVLYDLNVDRAQYAGSDGVDFGAPEWTGAPDAVGGVDGYRTVTLTHWFDASRAGAYVELGVLSKVLLRSDCWLLVQMTDLSEPRWFHVWRSTPASLSPDQVFIQPSGALRGLWGISLSLTADPYLYGERVSIPTLTIANDPSVATNPMCAVLPEIFGDAPAPLRVSVDPGPSDNERYVIVSAPRSTGATPVQLIDIGSGDGWVTLGSDVGAPVADTAYVDGSYRQCTFATDTSLTFRLRANFSAIPVGRYAAFLRVAPSTTGDAYTFSVDFGLMTTEVVTAHPTSAAWIPLGEVATPNDGIPVAVGTGNIIEISINAGNIGAGRPVNLDALLLVPLESFDAVTNPSFAVLSHDFGRSGTYVTTPANATVWDGDTETWWLSTTAGGLWRPQAAVSGMFPYVSPGVDNVLTLLTGVKTAILDVGAWDVITSTVDVDLSYLPRYLWPAP